MTARIERAYAILAVFVVLALQPELDHWGKTLLTPFCELLVFGSLAAAWQLRRVHESLAILAAVVLVNCSVSFSYVYGGMAWSMAHVGNSAYTAAAFASAILVAVSVPIAPARKAFSLAAICASLGVIYRAADGAPSYARWEFIGNPSQTGSMIACALPFMLIGRPRGALGAFFNIAMISISITAIVLIGTVTPWLCMFAVIAAVVAREEKRTIPYMAAFFIFAATFYFMIQDRLVAVEHVNGSGRFIVWKIGAQHWLSAPWHIKLFGFGGGSTQTLLPKWYPSDGQRDWWLWFHNSWLQCLVEFGAAGLVAAAMVAVSAARIAWLKSSRDFATLAAIAVWGFCNYPTSTAFPAMFCTFAVVAVFRENRDG